jgi:RimJ/RimL family protein N-acetyltransferase
MLKNKMTNNLLTYKKVNSPTNQRLIWKINNEKISRKYSRNVETFSYKSHLKWFEQTLKNKKESIYLVKKDKEVIGIIRRKKKENKLFLSWALVKKFRGKNYGTSLIKEFIKKNNNTFFAEIHELNKSSVKICKRAGFKFQRKKGNFLFFKLSKKTKV